MMCKMMKATFINLIDDNADIEYFVQTHNHKVARKSGEKQLKVDGYNIKNFRFTVTTEVDLIYPYVTTIY